MNAQVLDRVARALATGMPRRGVLKTAVAALSSGGLVQLSSGESDARLSRCCRRSKRRLKRLCIEVGGETCNHVTDFSCQKTGPGECGAIATCTTKDGAAC